jgi:hypothetical protein
MSVTDNALFKFKFYDRKRKRLMDVILIDWEHGVLTCVYGTQNWISLLEDGELLRFTGRVYGKEEVYEGFLIRHIADGNEPLRALEVYFDTKFAGFYVRSLDDEHLYRIPLPE